MSTRTLALSIFALAASLSMARSQSTLSTVPTPNAPAPTLSSTEQTIKDIKNPVSWMNWGADFRARNEYFDNILTLTPANSLHEQDYFRFRARLWTSITPVDDLSLNGRLVTEPREWMMPAGYTPKKGHSGWDWTEGVVDNLNVQWRNILSQPLTATVGRQDILLGDGWLVGDGTPFDGSWTYFLDSARVAYDLKDQHTVIEAIGILQDAKDNGWMPVINEQYRYLMEQNEKGAILNVQNSSLKAMNVNGYFFYKHDDKVNAFSPSNPAPRGGDNADIYTLGGRLTGSPADHWKYSLEGAYQFGQKQDATVVYPTPTTDYRNINAFGANAKASYLFKDRLNNQVSLSYEYLSGDNPKTQGDEMFDVLWGRWPRWSEIGLYSYATETRIGQEANLQRIGPTWSLDPAKNLNFSASYFALFAPEQVPTRGVNVTNPNTSAFSSDGNFRGHFAQAVLKYKFSQHASAHLWGEMLIPGDYYARHSLWSFLRAEVMFTF